MIYGYARVSTTSQDVTAQVNALKQAGAEQIIEEKKSGKDLNRDGLQSVLALLQEGDTLLVTKMDRIARNVREGIGLIEELDKKGINLKALNMPEMSGTSGKLVRNILLSVAEWEREMMLERQREGIELAKKNGKYKNKPRKYIKHKGMESALKDLAEREQNKKTVKDICEEYSVTRSSLYNIAKERGIL